MTKFFILILLSNLSFGEYRVYQYVVKDKVNNINDSYVTSTLNPRAFIAYNGGSKIVGADLLRTWLCIGNTSGKKAICPNPYTSSKSVGIK